MSALKRALDNGMHTGTLDRQLLKNIRREVQQAIYAHLAEKGIQISILMNDPMAQQLEAAAERSASDLLRFENYMLDKIFDLEKEMERSKGLTELIDAYISEHYAERLGRTEIGAAFYLMPEYIARLYKKKTGRSLKDAVNDCRLEQAKKLLRTTDRAVSDIALDVGFDNLSYFSTLFKKAVGKTPVEYRKDLRKI